MYLPLKSVLSRLEISPPVICADEAERELQPVFRTLVEQSIVRPIARAGAVDCSDCGRRCRVEFITDQRGESRGFIHCRDCGIAEVPLRRLERWEIDVATMLGTVFRDIRQSVEERVADRLWQVGNATWVGRPREVWFLRGYRNGDAEAAIGELKRRPKAIVFAPTETGAGRWQDAVGNLVIALESAVFIEDAELRLDVDYVESRIVDAGLADNGATKKQARKRAERATDIEKLENEIIQHLLAARDHAYATKEQTGEPQLLPRPTQKALGERVGLPEWKVSRCMRDEWARELRLYWEIAADLEQIMTFKGPVSMGRTT